MTSLLPADARIGSVDLQVSTLRKALGFYADLIGLRVVESSGLTAALSADGSPPALLRLTEIPGARPRPKHTTGLFHVAIRLPDRRQLGRLLGRLLECGVVFQGFSDHGVSEALYLTDPDGNGLELYRDRPRDEWPMNGEYVAMTTDPLDRDVLLAETADDTYPWDGIHPDSDIGHIHLQVSGLELAEDFYCELIGMTAMQRDYPGALFMAAGGYHHHLGANIWHSAGASPPPPEAVGLKSFSLAIPDAAAVSAAGQRLRDAGVTVEDQEAGALRVRDPDDVAVELHMSP